MSLQLLKFPAQSPRTPPTGPKDSEGVLALRRLEAEQPHAAAMVHSLIARILNMSDAEDSGA